MSEDTLSQLVADAIAHNISPLIRWLYAVFASVIAGTAFVVGLWADVRYGLVDVKRDASEAKSTALSAIQATAELRTSVVTYGLDIAVLKIQTTRGGVKP